MHSLPDITHPNFCDPRLCEHRGPRDVVHLSTPMTLPAADHLYSVGLFRLDHIDPEPGCVGEERMCLGVIDETDADDRVRRVPLSAVQARLLAAMLTCGADQLDARSEDALRRGDAR